MIKTILFLGITFTSILGFAKPVDSDQLILEVRLIDEGPVAPESTDMSALTRDACSGTPAERFDINEIISLGEKLWQIVKAGAPVLNFTAHSASAIPYGAVCPFYMAGWSIPQSKTFQLTYKNLYGMEMVNFKYKLIYSAGGSYNGVGKYLANVSIHPADIKVVWGQTFDASVAITNVLNIGSVESPVAGMQVVLDWNLSNPINKFKSQRVYFVDGLGKVTEL